ncbi:MAG TPA: XRE family transcriptional regulator [Myxococcales bacterium]|nr:XRE family transcriptional regulator [Myxococcales bacterium]
MGSALGELGRRLAAARRDAGLETDDLARKAAVEPERVGAFEAGQGGLGAAQLVRLAKVLGVSPGQFLHDQIPTERAFPEPHVLLKTATVGAYLDRGDQDAIAQGLERARRFSMIGTALGTEDLARLAVPSAAPADNAHEDGYRRALEVRRWMPERHGPLRDLRRLVEDRFGIFVLPHNFAPADVWGAAARSGEARLIAFRADRPETAGRFAIAHELAHHLYDLGEAAARADEGHEGDRRFWFEPPPIEKRANAFAAMLLAPTDAVAQHLGRPQQTEDLTSARDIANTVSQFFGLGFAASVWHSHNLKYISRDVVPVLLDTAPADHVSGFEEPSAYDALERRVFMALARDAISLGRARELIGARADLFVAVDGPR